MQSFNIKALNLFLILCASGWDPSCLLVFLSLHSLQNGPGRHNHQAECCRRLQPAASSSTRQLCVDPSTTSRTSETLSCGSTTSQVLLQCSISSGRLFASCRSKALLEELQLELAFYNRHVEPAGWFMFIT